MIKDNETRNIMYHYILQRASLEHQRCNTGSLHPPVLQQQAVQYGYCIARCSLLQRLHGLFCIVIIVVKLNFQVVQLITLEVSIYMSDITI